MKYVHSNFAYWIVYCRKIQSAVPNASIAHKIDLTVLQQKGLPVDMCCGHSAEDIQHSATLCESRGEVTSLAAMLWGLA